MPHTLVPIVRKDGLAIYGKVIGPGGKLGQYEFHNSYTREVIHYSLFSEAEKHLNAIYSLMQKR